MPDRATQTTAPVPADGRPRSGVYSGVVYGLMAYGWWGFVAVYFKAVAHVSPFEVLGHRIIWSVVLLAALVHLRRQWGEARALLGAASTWRSMSVSTVLIAVNWLVFIYAVAAGRLVEASLGYFINPLVNVVLGRAFLGERLRPWQWVAVSLAAVGVGVYTWRVGSLPWISLVLAVSFGLYGLVRKRASAGPILGLFFETALLAPAAVGTLLLLAADNTLTFASRDGDGSWRMDLLLAAGGVVTTMPLLWFAAAARRLRLSTIGFMQYLSPSIQFLLAVLAFGEPFGVARAVAFGVIWVGVAVFVADSLAHRSRRAPRPAVAPPD